MRFTVTQSYGRPAEAVLAVYTDPSLYPELGGPRIGDPHLLDLDVDRAADRCVVRVRYRFTADLPGPARRLLDPDKLTWVEETTYDLAGRTGTTRLVPDNYPDRISAAGTITLADTDQGSTRRVEGEMSVRAPLVAGRVERAILDGVEEQLAFEEAAVRRRLAPGT